MCTLIISLCKPYNVTCISYCVLHYNTLYTCYSTGISTELWVILVSFMTTQAHYNHKQFNIQAHVWW